MFSLERTVEILLFTISNFAPYLVYSYHIFKNHFRFSKKVTAFACILMFLIQFATRYWSAMNGISTNLFMSLFRLIVFILGYMILFDLHWGKVVFIELIFANMGNFILIAAICIERNVFPTITHSLYCWHSSVVMIALHLIITLPWALHVKQYFVPMLENRLIKKEWNYYWLVPIVFYIIWQYQVNAGTKTGLENIQNPYNVIFLFIINIGSLLIYYIMLMMDSQLAKNLALETQRHYEDLEEPEYQKLQEHMDETRRIRHDLKHHIHTMSYYLESKEYDKLKEYLDSYRDSIPDGEVIRFCQHGTINNLIFYFAAQAREHQIDFDVQIAIPKELQMNDQNISILLGNLLENALDACKEQTASKRRIVVRGKADDHSLIFTIDNTFENDLKRDKNGEFITTKSTGNGIGVISARKIVERYNGVFSADKKDDMFCVSFMLNL